MSRRKPRNPILSATSSHQYNLERLYVVERTFHHPRHISFSRHHEFPPEKPPESPKKIGAFFKRGILTRRKPKQQRRRQKKTLTCVENFFNFYGNCYAAVKNKCKVLHRVILKHRRRKKKEHEEIEKVAEEYHRNIHRYGSEFSLISLKSDLEMKEQESDFDMRLRRSFLDWIKGKKKMYLKVRKGKRIDMRETVYEEDMSPARILWPTRTQFRSSLDQLSLNHVIFRVLRKILRPRKTSENFTLNEYEFYLMLLMSQIDTFQAANLANLFSLYGLIPSLIMVSIVTIFIQIPLMVWVLSLCAYAKSMCLDYFVNSMPLVAGFGYTALFFLIFDQSRRLVLLEACIRILQSLFSGIEWVNCNVSAEPQCVPINTNFSHNTRCSEENKMDNYEYYSTEHYVEFEVFQAMNGAPGIYYLFNMLVALIMFLVAMNGVEHVKKWLLRVQLCAGVLLAICILYISITWFSLDIYSVNVFKKKTFTFQFILDLTSTSLNFHELPFVMWLGALKPPNLKPSIALCWVAQVKFLILTVIGACYGVLAVDIASRYKFTNQECIHFSGMELLFAMPIDYFSTHRSHLFWLTVWLASVASLIFIHFVFVTISFVDTIVRKYPKMGTRIPLLTFLSILFMLVVRFLNEIPGYYREMRHFRVTGMVLVNNMQYAFFALASYFLYTPVRFLRDYEYFYGSQVSVFWISCWRCTPYWAMALLILSFANTTKQHSLAKVQFFVATFFLIVACTLTVVYCFTKMYQSIILQALKYASNPNKKWGPHTKSEREDRKSYERKQKTLIRTCAHHCLLGSKEYAEKKAQNLAKVEDWYAKAPVDIEMVNVEAFKYFNVVLSEEN